MSTRKNTRLIARASFSVRFLKVNTFWLLFCHTTISGATMKTGTSTIYGLCSNSVSFVKLCNIYKGDFL